MKRIYTKLQAADPGFTLIEVLISILVITTFTLVALEAMVISAIFRVRARQNTDATNWIQTDLEKVKRLTSLYTASDSTTRCASTNANQGYAAGLLTYLGGTPVTVDQYILGQNFRRTRTARVYDATDGATAPYNVLKVTYDVTQIAGGASRAYFTTEVIPDEALNCP